MKNLNSRKTSVPDGPKRPRSRDWHPVQLPWVVLTKGDEICKLCRECACSLPWKDGHNPQGSDLWQSRDHSDFTVTSQQMKYILYWSKLHNKIDFFFNLAHYRKVIINFTKNFTDNFVKDLHQTRHTDSLQLKLCN